MAFVNLKNKLIQVKIVYCGPGRGGETTNLEYINHRFQHRIRSEMVTVKTHGDRTLFSDLLPFDIGLVNGYQIKIQLCTVPGQVKYDATRRRVLRGVDGIVFVADGMSVRREDKHSTAAPSAGELGQLPEKPAHPSVGVAVQQDGPQGARDSGDAR